ncbi:MAG: efflux RND transporter periplasmic adaptor subunit [Fimbriimonadaceae bacterium]|nr:efflux RND transporter periplasmic adaptor subunit [Fimbriimonadaceae bacterium]
MGRAAGRLEWWDVKSYLQAVWRSRRGRWGLVGAVVLLAWATHAVKGQLPEVETAVARTADLWLTIAASGSVEGVASDLSFNETGRLVELYVREGDTVREEQVLARIEPGLTLSAGGVPLDVIRAPFDGWVVAVHCYQGSVVQQGLPVLRLVQQGQRWVTAYLDSEDAAQVREGQRFTCRAGGYLSRAWPLAVVRVGHEAVPRDDVPGSAKQVRVRLQPQEAGLVLPPGTPVDIDGEVELAHQALVIPAAAVVRENGRSRVWRLRAGQVQPVEISTGANNFRQIAVLSGLAPGDTVVVEGKTSLTPGSLVRAKAWTEGGG